MMGVLGSTQGGNRSMGVEVVTTLDIGEGLLYECVDFRLIEPCVSKTLEHATTGPFARVGRQKDLDLSLREHNGADIAPFCDNIARLGEMTLAAKKRLANTGVGRNLGNDVVSLWSAYLTRNVSTGCLPGGSSAITDTSRSP